MINLRVGKAIKYMLSFSCAYKLKNFLQNAFFKPVFYDIFARPSHNDICVIAPYFSLGGFARSVCVCSFGGEEKAVRPVIVDDPEKNCLIVIFQLPADMKAPFAFVIKRGNRELYKG
ncbi:MAG: hypothetical protein P4L61_02915, partial [Candidatus Pacebacteria bacterium]|nr:hypothetical protein [Candidatus Paceibacterota bacterium]